MVIKFFILVDGLSKFKKFRDNFDLYLFGGSNFSNYEIKFKENFTKILDFVEMTDLF